MGKRTKLILGIAFGAVIIFSGALFGLAKYGVINIKGLASSLSPSSGQVQITVDSSNTGGGISLFQNGSAVSVSNGSFSGNTYTIPSLSYGSYSYQFGMPGPDGKPCMGSTQTMSHYSSNTTATYPKFTCGGTNPGTSLIQGQVTKSGTGLTIQDATVTIGSNPAVTTDGSGYYRIDNMTTGNFTVMIVKSGYDALSQPVTIANGINNKNFSLVESGGQTQHPLTLYIDVKTDCTDTGCTNRDSYGKVNGIPVSFGSFSGATSNSLSQGYNLQFSNVMTGNYTFKINDSTTIGYNSAYESKTVSQNIYDPTGSTLAIFNLAKKTIAPQTTTFDFIGSVKDSSGAPIAGAFVNVQTPVGCKDDLPNFSCPWNKSTTSGTTPTDNHDVTTPLNFSDANLYNVAQTGARFASYTGTIGKTGYQVVNFTILASDIKVDSKGKSYLSKDFTMTKLPPPLNVVYGSIKNEYGEVVNAKIDVIYQGAQSGEVTSGDPAPAPKFNAVNPPTNFNSRNYAIQIPADSASSLTSTLRVSATGYTTNEIQVVSSSTTDRYVVRNFILKSTTLLDFYGNVLGPDGSKIRDVWVEVKNQKNEISEDFSDEGGLKPSDGPSVPGSPNYYVSKINKSDNNQYYIRFTKSGYMIDNNNDGVDDGWMLVTANPGRTKMIDYKLKAVGGEYVNLKMLVLHKQTFSPIHDVIQLNCNKYRYYEYSADNGEVTFHVKDNQQCTARAGSSTLAFTIPANFKSLTDAQQVAFSAPLILLYDALIPQIPTHNQLKIKVVDQHGAPVPNMLINYGPLQCSHYAALDSSWNIKKAFQTNSTGIAVLDGSQFQLKGQHKQYFGRQEDVCFMIGRVGTTESYLEMLNTGDLNPADNSLKVVFNTNTTTMLRVLINDFSSDNLSTDQVTAIFNKIYIEKKVNGIWVRKNYEKIIEFPSPSNDNNFSTATFSNMGKGTYRARVEGTNIVSGVLGLEEDTSQTLHLPNGNWAKPAAKSPSLITTSQIQYSRTVAPVISNTAATVSGLVIDIKSVATSLLKRLGL